MQTFENTSRLRHEIDSGNTGDKVDFVDPAAAPLGTDAEAGGAAPAPEELSMETVRVAPPVTGMSRDQAGIVGYALLAGAAGIAILGIVALTA